MKNLKVWQKLLLLGVIFMLPFARVTYKLVSTINSEKVGFAQNEVNGVAYYTPLLGLLNDVQQHRALAGALLSGDASFKESVTTKESDIDNDIKAVDAADQQLGGGLHVSEKWTALRAECHDFLQKAKELSANDSYQQHTKLIGDILTLVSDVSDNSQLTLDPDIDSYYLMDVIMFQGPELSEKLSQASAMGSAMAVGKTGTPEQFENLSRQSILAEYVQDEVADSLSRVLNFNSTLHSQLDASVQANAKGVEQACGYLKNLAASRKMDASATDYEATMTKNIGEVFAMEGEAAKSLTTLLNIRIEKWQSTMYAAFAESILWLLLAWLVAFFVMRNITVPLKSVVEVADQIASGNLVVTMAGDKRRDEMGVLSHAFERMVASLKEMVGVAEQIAAGNLAVTVKPRSENDLMGKAFATMIAKLSGLVGQVQKSGIQVNTSVTEIAATSKQQQATASEIAATTSEISATSRQIAATSRELVKNMSQVASVSEQSATMAGNGQAGLSRMEETMGQVMEAAGSINAKLAVLSEKASNINQVVTTITKVADQTNLLSLNAAIEAEKAGEYGRGFAVVATEIRRLADQTAVATYDIAQMVKEIQSAVAAGVMGMDKFSEEVRRGITEVQQVGGQLTQITHDVQSLAPRFEAVNDGMQAQSTAAEQITEALAQLSEAAQQTVESLRQSNQVIDGLNQASIGLRGGVSKFKLEE